MPGALVSALTELGVRDIDLTRIESRPTRTELGTYMFFLDCVGHIDDSAVAEALKALHRRCADVRYLGSWPTGTPAGRCRRSATRRSAGWRGCEKANPNWPRAAADERPTRPAAARPVLRQP
ncbi:ACT domain protein [Mycobacterium xenopi 3993]|nr:ACT domain protein [Mycobacterium xenopi 3993]